MRAQDLASTHAPQGLSSLYHRACWGQGCLALRGGVGGFWRRDGRIPPADDAAMYVRTPLTCSMLVLLCQERYLAHDVAYFAHVVRLVASTLHPAVCISLRVYRMCMYVEGEELSKRA